MSRTAVKLLEAASGGGESIPLLLGRITNVHTNVDGYMLGVQKATDGSTWFLWDYDADGDIGFAGFDESGTNVYSKHLDTKTYNMSGQGAKMTPYSDKIILTMNVGVSIFDTSDPSTFKLKQIMTSSYYGGTVPIYTDVLGDTLLFATEGYSTGVSTSVTNPVFSYVDLTSTASTIHAGTTFPYGTNNNKQLPYSGKSGVCNDGTDFFLAGRTSNYIFRVDATNNSNSSNVISRHTFTTGSNGDTTQWGIAADDDHLYVNYTAFTNSFTRRGQGLAAIDKTSNTIVWNYGYHLAGAVNNDSETVADPNTYGCHIWKDDDGNLILYRHSVSATNKTFNINGTNRSLRLKGTLMSIKPNNGQVNWANGLYFSGAGDNTTEVQYNRATNNSGTHILVPYGFYAYAGLPIDGSGTGVAYDTTDAENPTGWYFAYEDLGSISRETYSTGISSAYTTSAGAYYDGTTATSQNVTIRDWTVSFTPGIDEEEVTV